MERVVYLIGAGFSAPLGLPVIADFLDKSKAQYEGDPERFRHFDKVFQTIRAMAFATTIYKVNLSDIEEVLSLLEMQEYASSTDMGDLLRDYISDVISHHTPPIEWGPFGSGWAQNTLPAGEWAGYAAFALFAQSRALRRTDAEIATSPAYLAVKQTDPSHSYSVISLNYDLVLENAAGALATRAGSAGVITRPTPDGSGPAGGIPLAKLHGSIDSGIIVPPTWRKGSLHSAIDPEWRLAYEMLSNAHHIRIIGYSLPPTDAYVRYLLGAAAVNSFFLKRLDVLCWDPTNKIKQRYDDFIGFRRYRFLNGLTQNYLQPLLHASEAWPSVVGPDNLERAHANAFGVS